MSKMIKRVAYAMEAATKRDGFLAWEEAARIAIEEMRVPTPEMLSDAGTMEGYSEDNSCSLAGPDADHIDWWKSMIDAALAEGRS